MFLKLLSSKCKFLASLILSPGGRNWLYRNFAEKLGAEVPKLHDYLYLAKILQGKDKLATRNRELAMKEIQEGKVLVKHNPICIDYLATFSGCNMFPRCPKCYANPPQSIKWSWKGNQYMGLEDFLITASYLQESSQAEALINPYFKELVHATSQGKPRLVFITNGIGLNTSIRKIIVGRTNSINVSLDSCKANTYEKLQGTAKQFETVVDNVRELAKIKRDSGKSFPLIQLNYTACRENIKEFEDFCVFAIEIGVDRVVLAPLQRWKHLMDRVVRRGNFIFRYHSQLISDEEVYEIVKKAKEKYGSKITIFEPMDQLYSVVCFYDRDLERLQGPVCMVPWVTFFPTADGNVYLCTWLDLIIGNWRLEGLRNIWNGHQIKRAREDILRFGIPRVCLKTNTCPLVRRIKTLAARSGEGEIIEGAKKNWEKKAEYLLPFISQAIKGTTRENAYVVRGKERVPLTDYD
jgi:MoaA/NifB/PqqE/SkfB family radical SAM enzyme